MKESIVLPKIPEVPAELKDEAIKSWISGKLNPFFNALLKVLQQKQKDDSEENTKSNNNKLPIGSWYTQYANSTGVFSDDEEPAVLFGGTWTEPFSTEYVFFRTEGESETRTDGLQLDQFLSHLHYIRKNGTDIEPQSTVWSNTEYPQAVPGGSYGSNQTLGVGLPKTDGTYTLRTGSETRPRNRLIKVWYRES